MKFKLSKSEWEQIGKTTGWMKISQVANPTSPDAKQIVMTLNKIQSEMLPNNAGQARGIINQLLEIIDTDFQQQQGLEQQPQQQQQPSSTLSRGFQGGQANQAIPVR